MIRRRPNMLIDGIGKDCAMKDVLRPPAGRARSEISKAVGKLERLKPRRRALATKLDEMDEAIKAAKRFAAALINDVAPDAAAKDQGELA
jgi:hypothetical protein